MHRIDKLLWEALYNNILQVATNYKKKHFSIIHMLYIGSTASTSA